MRNYIFICFILMGFLALAQEDPRDAFMGYYKFHGYTQGVPSGTKKNIDTTIVFKKSPDDSSKIRRHWFTETTMNYMDLFFSHEDSSFDRTNDIPKHYDHGFFYGTDSAYYFFFDSRPLGMPQQDDVVRYYLWGKWIKPLGTGIEELNFQVHIFPNPTKDRVQFSGVTASSYVLYSLSGKQLKAGQVKNREVSLHELPQGVYLLQLQVGEETVVKRIIKE